MAFAFLGYIDSQVAIFNLYDEFLIIKISFLRYLPLF